MRQNDIFKNCKLPRWATPIISMRIPVFGRGLCEEMFAGDGIPSHKSGIYIIPDSSLGFIAWDPIPDSFRFTSLTPTWILGSQTPVDVESGIH